VVVVLVFWFLMGLRIDFAGIVMAEPVTDSDFDSGVIGETTSLDHGLMRMT
jgi:hypothetical protein